MPEVAPIATVAIAIATPAWACFARRPSPSEATSGSATCGDGAVIAPKPINERERSLLAWAFEPHGRSGIPHQQPRRSAPVGRGGVDVDAVGIDERVVVEPLDLVVDRAFLGNRVVLQRRHVED